MYFLRGKLVKLNMCLFLMIDTEKKDLSLWFIQSKSDGTGKIVPWLKVPFRELSSQNP